MYWEDFPEAVNNVPEAEEKLQIDPNLGLMTVVPKSVLKHKGSFKPPFTFQNYREVENALFPTLRPQHFTR